MYARPAYSSASQNKKQVKKKLETEHYVLELLKFIILLVMK